MSRWPMRTPAWALCLSCLAAAPAPRAPTPLAASGLAPAVPRVRWIEQRAAERDTTGLVAALLRDRALSTRGAAARALGLIQERSTAPALVAALADRSATVRREAAFALGLMGDSTAVGPIALRWEQEIDPGARETMVTALGYLAAQAGAPTVARALESKRESERWAAALAAARIRARSLASPLTARADALRPEMRWRVAYALGRIGDKAGALALRNLAHDRSEEVRMSAARAIAEVGDSASGPLLATLLHDTAWRVRVNAAHALGLLGARDQAAAIRPLLQDASPHVRWEAALALGVLGDSASVPALTRALSDSSTGVVQGAALSLLKLQGERAIPTVAPQFDLLPGFLRSGLLEALGQVPGTMALQTLLARARDGTDPPGASGAAAGLAQRKADALAVLPALRALITLGGNTPPRDFTVVCNAADALGQLGDSASVPALTQLLHRFGTAQDADIRATAASALAALKTRAALDALAPARRDPERRIRETACAALGLPADSIGLVKNPLLRAPGAKPVPSVALVQTERGLITIAFDHARAPVTVENFVSLARAKYFDGFAFHRVVPNFVVQDGCPRGDGWGGPGYMIPCEYNDHPYETGTVGMALSGKDTGGSQWFITLSPQPRLEGRYTVFGVVTRGMDVAERIMPGDRILRVTLK
ncbi:MAG TPA: HEAT repeat domain-containing protein [Candidatus Binatia bacterium]|nr:HEAT repeat domain-containing protein [Candidatus Binatia bacterium]